MRFNATARAHHDRAAAAEERTDHPGGAEHAAVDALPAHAHLAEQGANGGLQSKQLRESMQGRKAAASGPVFDPLTRTTPDEWSVGVRRRPNRGVPARSKRT